MAVGDNIPECYGTGTSGDPYKYKNATGFKNAIAVTNAYVEANEDNMVFDVNDGVLSNTCNLYCKSLNGKGTTIRNLYANATNSILVTPKNHNCTYSNINFYNMLILVTTGGGSDAMFFKPSQDSGGSGDYPTVWNNCNFTGVYKGTLGNSTIYGVISGDLGSGIYAYTKFNNCTFNINFELTKNNNNNFSVIKGDSNRIQFSNCTFNISGTIKAVAGANNGNLYICDYPMCTNCTFMNKQSNPLTIGVTAKVIPYFVLNNNSGYNYFKMYVSNTYSSSNPDFAFNYATGTLVNTTRITGMNSISGGIRMQETDTTADTYIYSATNLAAKGFPVGTTIE